MTYSVFARFTWGSRSFSFPFEHEARSFSAALLLCRECILTQIMQGADPAPVYVKGHWKSPAGQMLANEYLGRERTDLAKGDLSDFEIANGIFLANRNDLDLIIWQTAAKERIRWLSAQLAAANQKC